MKIILLFISLTLSGCFDSQFEIKQDQHIKEAEGKLKSIMVNYSLQSQSINNVEEILKYHQTALNEFNQVKNDFSKYKEENRLQAIISLYDYAFTLPIIKQLQLIELVSPIWNRDITELEKLKDFSYFTKHQQFLSELISIIEHNKTSFSDYHEDVRKMLVSSKLEENDRKRLWLVFNDLTIKHISTLNQLMHPIQTRIESEKEISSFFYRNKNGYATTELRGLEFYSFELLDSYNRKLKEMNKKYNATRVISKLAKP